MTTAICLLLIAATDQTAAAPGFAFFEPAGSTHGLHAIAHRGAMAQAPENTKAALEFSIADGVEWVEVDVRLTHDGHHVLFHDDRLDRTTDATGPVEDRTLAEIRQADGGVKFARRFSRQRILTLDEGLRLAKGRVNLYLDCKRVEPLALARALVTAGMERQVAVYGKPEILRAIQAEFGDKIALTAKWRPQFGLDRWIDDVKPHVVEIDAKDITAEVCLAFHRRGIKVEGKALDPNDRPEIWDHVEAAGADWIQTDRAEEVLARRMLKRAKPNRVKIAYHRGASRYTPENTLESLRKAVVLGADYVEFDIRTTRDGVFVLLHDATLNRTTSGKGAVRDRTAAEIALLDAGSWFGRSFAGARTTTLDAFLDAAAPTGIGLYVDAKDITPEALAEVLARHGLTERAVVYQHAGYLEKLRAIAPNLRRMPPLHDSSQVDSLAERVRPYAFDTAWTILSKPLIDHCHSLGIKVFSDAIGAHELVNHYQQAIRDGIDVIQTDHPLRVLRAIEELEHTGAVGR